MNAPASSTLKFAAVHTRQLSLQVLRRQRELTQPVSVALQLARNAEPLPASGHWLVTLQVRLQARDADGADVFDATCVKEMVAMFENTDEDSQRRAVQDNVPSYLYPYVRAELGLLLANAGYLNVILPPLSALPPVAAESALQQGTS
jgi:preprotein translocase subunit SecB